jgi:ACT domain-containing protein
MTATNNNDHMQDKLDSLQEQIAMLHVKIEQQSGSLAAVAKFTATQEVDRLTSGRLLTSEQVHWLSEQIDMARDRKKMRSELLMHLLKMGGAGTVGFIAWALWNEFVAKIKGA